MKNRLMPFYNKIMLRKRHIIETINDMLKNEAQIVHSRHRSLNNFIMNLISALGVYCFFDNKPQALQEMSNNIFSAFLFFPSDGGTDVAVYLKGTDGIQTS